MTTVELYNIIGCYVGAKPNANITFANNKVPVTKIVYDEKTDSINLR